MDLRAAPPLTLSTPLLPHAAPPDSPGVFTPAPCAAGAGRATCPALAHHPAPMPRIALVLAALVAFAGRPAAQPFQADRVPAAEAAFQDGLAAYRAGDYAAAERLFTRAATDYGFTERTTAATLMAARAAYADGAFDRAALGRHAPRDELPGQPLRRRRPGPAPAHRGGLRGPGVRPRHRAARYRGGGLLRAGPVQRRPHRGRRAQCPCRGRGGAARADGVPRHEGDRPRRRGRRPRRRRGRGGRGRRAAVQRRGRAGGGRRRGARRDAPRPARDGPVGRAGPAVRVSRPTRRSRRAAARWPATPSAGWA